MTIEITKTQLNAIVQLKEDIKTMIGCGDNDLIWSEHIELIEKMLAKNGLNNSREIIMSTEDKDFCDKEEIGCVSCSSCGAEFIEQEDLDKLQYSRTTASGDHFYCSICGKEEICV